VLTYAKLKRDRRKFLALTGVTPKEFQLLWPAFEHAYQRRFPVKKTRAGTTRQRRAGGGRKSVLDTPEQKLLFALVYLKTYPLQTLKTESGRLVRGPRTTGAKIHSNKAKLLTWLSHLTAWTLVRMSGQSYNTLDLEWHLIICLYF
jgi:hypothetical protein